MKNKKTIWERAVSFAWLLVIVMPLGGAVGCIATQGDLTDLQADTGQALTDHAERQRRSQEAHEARMTALIEDRLAGTITEEQYAENLAASMRTMQEEIGQSWTTFGQETKQAVDDLKETIKGRAAGLSAEVSGAVGAGGAGILALLARWAMNATAARVHKERDEKYLARGDQSSAYTVTTVPYVAPSPAPPGMHVAPTQPQG